MISKKANARRHLLIDKSIDGTITPEEQIELDKLQDEAGRSRAASFEKMFEKLQEIEDMAIKEGLLKERLRKHER